MTDVHNAVNVPIRVNMPQAPEGWKYWPWPKGNGPLTNPIKAPTKETK